MVAVLISRGHNGMFASLLCGGCLPTLISRVTSRKLALVMLALTVIFK